MHHQAERDRNGRKEAFQALVEVRREMKLLNTRYVSTYSHTLNGYISQYSTAILGDSLRDLNQAFARFKSNEFLETQR